MPTPVHYPQTPTEWQEAVDAIAVVLAFDAAHRYGLIKFRNYGLITTGPEPDHERCAEILEYARKRGITPRPPASCVAPNMN